jgi:hypothetical protein
MSGTSGGRPRPLIAFFDYGDGFEDLYPPDGIDKRHFATPRRPTSRLPRAPGACPADILAESRMQVVFLDAGCRASGHEKVCEARAAVDTDPSARAELQFARAVRVGTATAIAPA